MSQSGVGFSTMRRSWTSAVYEADGREYVVFCAAAPDAGYGKSTGKYGVPMLLLPYLLINLIEYLKSMQQSP